MTTSTEYISDTAKRCIPQAPSTVAAGLDARLRPARSTGDGRLRVRLGSRTAPVKTAERRSQYHRSTRGTDSTGSQAIDLYLIKSLGSPRSAASVMVLPTSPWCYRRLEHRNHRFNSRCSTTALPTENTCFCQDTKSVASQSIGSSYTAIANIRAQHFWLSRRIRKRQAFTNARQLVL